jgi:hypothetical protein
VLVGRQDLDVGIFLKIRRFDRSFALDIETQGGFVVGKKFKTDLLDIKQNVGDIFHDTVDSGVFMLNAVDPHRNNGRTLER